MHVQQPGDSEGHCSCPISAGRSCGRALGRVGAALALALCACLAPPAAAQTASEYLVEKFDYGFDSGPRSNPSGDPALVLGNTVSFSGANAMRLTLLDLRLNRGDQLRLVSQKDGIDQIITADDPQFHQPGYAGEFTTIIFNGDAIDFELTLAGESDGARYRIGNVLAAYYLQGGVASICGPTDDRVLVNDVCTVRVVNSGFGWGTGNMIGPNCMVTAGHVMSNGPWTIQRNVPPSTAAGIPVFPPASDQFTLPAPLTATTGSLAPGCPGACVTGNDWAVLSVPNNITGAPGAACNPAFRCNFTQDTNAVVRSRGYGISATAVQNGVLKGDFGQTVTGTPPPYSNPPELRHRIDTTRGDSGAAIRDISERIVAFHTQGGCTANNNGYNAGTLLTNPQLLTAICLICGQAPCPGPTGACCIGPNCTPMSPCDCRAAGGTYQGTGSTCTPNPCPPGDAVGACCSAGTCDVVTPLACGQINGVYAGHGTNCGPPAPCLGACCAPAGCTLTTAGDCVGIYKGDTSTCTPNPCNSGACCLTLTTGADTGECFIRSAAQCAANSGVFQGAGTTCTPNPCPVPTAACCMGANNLTCNMRTQAACATAGGAWLGVGVTCVPNLCRIAGACCLPNGTCNLVTQAVCDEQRGNFRGAGTTCAPNPCTPTGACCPPNGGACTVVNQATCFVVNQGVYFGNGSTCTPNPCTAANLAAFVPANDTCANALLVGVPSLTTTIGTPPNVRALSTRFAGVDVVPVCNVTSATTGGVWFRLVGNGRPVTVSTCRNAPPYLEPFDSIIGVFCGTCAGLTCVTANDDDPACRVRTRLSTVTFCAGSGTTYYVLVHGFGTAVGLFSLEITQGADCCVTGVNCAPTGACCTPAGVCGVLTESDCRCLGGRYMGDGTTCVPNPCPGACCVDGLCSWRTQVQCAGFGGTYFGNGTSCDADPCLHACCYFDGMCNELSVTNCLNSGGEPWGLGTSCTPNPCPPPAPIGACCKFDGSCLDLSPPDCFSVGGSYQGDTTTCGSLTCADVTGACCFFETCIVLEPFHCDYVGGVFGGLGAPCSPNPCIVLTGACCYSTGLCQILSGSSCSADGGAYQGDGTTCDIGSCDPYFGACCLPDGPCGIMSDSDCAAQGGQFQGFGSDCGGGYCLRVACCFGDGGCLDLLLLECDALGGTPNPSGFECALAGCAQPDLCGGALPGDSNCDGVINNFDIDGFVIGLLYVGDNVPPANYLTSVPSGGACWKQRLCWGDVDCSGSFNNLDIDPFVQCLLLPPPAGLGCPSCQFQACCLPGAYCTEVLPVNCAALGGTAQGGGTSCGFVICP